MSGPIARDRPGDAEDPRIRRSWFVLTGSIGVMGLIAAIRLALEPGGQLSLITVALVVLAGAAAVLNRFAVRALEAVRRAEAESFARILRGLSRSVSPDAIVDAIVEELGAGTGADHIVVVRRRPDARVLEATLINARSGGPSSSTIFPISDLEDPPDMARTARQPVGIQIAEGAEPVLVAFAGGANRRTERERRVHRVVTVGGGHDRRTTPRTRTRKPAPPHASTVDVLLARPRVTDPALLVADRIAARARGVYGLKHTLTAPLATDSGVVGAIVVSRRTAEPWPPAAQRILAGAAEEASAALSRAYSHREAEARASTDALTGLPNRRYFDEFCALLARRRRSEDAIGILMVDIDRFKVLNDTHGHAVGDEVLRAVSGAIAGAVREDDVPARFGGEEFAVLLRNPSLAEAVEVGERVRESVAALDLSRYGVAAASVSVGVAVATAPGEPIADLIERADRALYDAKRAGRDRVIAAA